MTLDGFHDRLREVLGEAPARQLADASGINPERLRRVLAGAPPTAELVIAVCRSLDLSADWLLVGRGPRLASDVRSQALGQIATEDLLGSLAASVRRLEEAHAAQGPPGAAVNPPAR